MNEKLQQMGARLKNTLKHWRIRQLSRADWRSRHRKVFSLHPEYSRPCPPALEAEHVALWRQLRPDVSRETLRVCYGIAGHTSPQIVPEEVFVSEIEPVLNRYDICRFLGNKNFYDRWLPGGRFPEVLLHNIDGEFYDREYHVLDPTRVGAVIDGADFPLVMKPSMGSGGRGVLFPESREALRAAMVRQTNFVVQRKLRQHEFFRRFQDHGLNTMRVNTYKSVTNNEIHILNTALRMGRAGSLDNETQGGIVRFVRADGALNRYAVDKYGAKYSRHPDTGFDFEAHDVVPRFEELKGLVREMAQQVYLARVVGFDVCLDAEGRWRFIEVNINGHTIRFAQYAGEPFFGPFTDEVIRYCRENPPFR
jgi:hypothetical protein